MSGFTDHFAGLAEGYTRFRPTYPAALFDWIGSLVPARARVWDCACGTGQASPALAERFKTVVATDGSADQIDQAPPHPDIDFRVATAEDSGLEPGSVDLITVAQALHWFDHAAFYEEVDRVGRPGGALVAWGYGFYRVDAALDAVTHRYAEEILGPWWPPERALLDNGYREIPFPFARIGPPPLEMTTTWTLPQLIGYLSTWSARKYYLAECHDDPLLTIEDDLMRAWGDPDRARIIRWPLTVLAGRL